MVRECFGNSGKSNLQFKKIESVSKVRKDIDGNYSLKLLEIKLTTWKLFNLGFEKKFSSF